MTTTPGTISPWKSREGESDRPWISYIYTNNRHRPTFKKTVSKTDSSRENYTSNESLY